MNGRSGREVAVAQAAMVAGVILCARTAWACGACMDESLTTSFPFVPYTILVFLGWLAAACVLRAVCRTSLPQPACHAPTRRVLLGFIGCIVGLGVFINFGAPGAILTPLFLVGVAWLAYVVYKVLRGAFSRPEVFPERAFAYLNRITLVLVAGSVVLGQYESQTVDYAIKRIGGLFGGGRAVATLRARGQEAVEPLITEIDKAWKPYSAAGHWLYMNRALGVLGQIGGPRAEQYLGDLVRNRVKLDGVVFWVDEVAACGAYATCAGARARPDLVALFERCTPEKRRGNLWALLIALLKTADPEAVAFVFDHMDDLLDRLNYGGAAEDSDNVGYAATALMECEPDPARLRVMRLEPPGDPRWRDYAWPKRSLEELKQTWQRDHERIRDRWARAFAAATATRSATQVAVTHAKFLSMNLPSGVCLRNQRANGQ